MQYFQDFEYLLIDAANAYGLDKENWDARLNWATDNMNDLVEIANDDPETESPFILRKVANAIDRVRHGLSTDHTMSLDCTASGAQILSVAAGCKVGCESTNVIDTGRRRDWYTDCTVKMDKLLPHGFPEGIGRNEVKKSLMTSLYNSRAKPRELFGEDTVELKAFYRVRRATVPGAVDAMKAINDCWDKNAYSHDWTMPDGFEVRLPVMESNAYRIEVDGLSHFSFTHRMNVNEPSSHGISLCANITQAIDSYIVRCMYRGAKEAYFDIATIHDAFYCHPRHMNELRDLYMKTLGSIYEMNLLNIILEQLIGRPYWETEKGLDISSDNSNYALS